MPTTPTIVLVHGAWADASSWTGVIRLLHAAGHDAVALPNTLRGPKADAAIVRNYFDTVDGPVLLVAHSYGGFVITNAATGAQGLPWARPPPTRRRCSSWSRSPARRRRSSTHTSCRAP